MAINPRKIKKKLTPRPAADLKQGNPRDLRNKALREANKMARERTPGPAKDVKAGGARAKFLADAKSGKMKAGSSSRALTTTGNNRAVVKSKDNLPMGSGSSRAVAVRPNTAVTVVKDVAKETGKLGLRGLLGAGSAVVGMVTEAKPAGSAQERSWERRNTEQRRMKGKVSGTAFNGGTPAKTARKYDTAIGPKKPVASDNYAWKHAYPIGPQKPIMPSVSMAGGGVNNPTAKKSSGVNQIKMAKSNAAARKKKAGATTSAAPAAPSAVKRTSFKGNWTGAAPTEMQKMGGARIKRPNLFTLLRKRKG